MSTGNRKGEEIDRSNLRAGSESLDGNERHDDKSSVSQSKEMPVEQVEEIEVIVNSSPAIKLRTLPIEESRISPAATEKTIEIFVNENAQLRNDLIRRCESAVYDMFEQLCAGQVPTVTYRIPTLKALTEQVKSQNSQDNAESPMSLYEGHSVPFDSLESMEEGQESQEELPGQRRVVRFIRKASQRKMALMMTTMANVHNLLLHNTTETRRSLFYKLKNGKATSAIVTNQKKVDDAVACLANLLECSPWDTGLVGTSKGLAAGDLTLTLANNERIDYNVPGGALIPHNVSKPFSIKSKANLVIVVEKDAIFQKLLQEMCPSELNCILVTGKGYPDVPTRMLVKALAEKFGLPVYVLVDADPHGMEILFTYKYGSINMCHDQRSLACSSVRWLGVRPSELSNLYIPKLPLTDNDVEKLDGFQSRLYIDEKFAEELEMMRKGKAEIEAVSGLTSMYLPIKIEYGDYI